jgi:hypothetical protein
LKQLGNEDFLYSEDAGLKTNGKINKIERME